MRARFLFIYFCVVFFFFFFYSQTLSRSVISVLGESTKNSEHYMSQTLGQAVSGTSFANFHYLTQGFQQPTLLSKDNTRPSSILDAIDVYPNPVTAENDFKLTISFLVRELDDYTVSIYDPRGRMLMNKKIESIVSGDFWIDMSVYEQGLYFIHVLSINKKMNRVFKIEKL